MAKDSVSPDFIEEALLFEVESMLKLIEDIESQIKEMQTRILALWKNVKVSIIFRQFLELAI